MAEGRGTLLYHLRSLLAPPRDPEASDADLLRGFVARRDEAAFAAVVRRHGPMVLGVCRRVVGNTHDAEDAFQAAFLVLARKAASLARPELLANWLHGTAVRVARAARARAVRRRKLEARAEPHAAACPAEEVAAAELRAVLNEEVGRLPEPCRAAFVLCHLEGRTHAEAAAALGCPLGSVSWRLAQARGLLRQRLGRRGAVLSVGLLAAPSAWLIGSTARAAVTFAAGAVEEGSAEAVQLGAAVLRSAALTRLKIIAVLLLAVSAAPMLAIQQAVRDPQPPPNPLKAIALDKDRGPPRTDPDGDPLPDGAVARLGTVRFRPGGAVAGVAFSPDGKTIAAAGYDDFISLLDAVSGKELRRFGAGVSRGATVAFSPDGKRLASASLDGKMHLWDAVTGKEVHALGARGTSILFSPDGRLLASVHSPAVRSGGAFPPPDKAIWLWDAATGKLLTQLRGHWDEVHSIAFACAGALLASAADRTVILWDVTARRELKRFEAEQVSRCVALAPDGKLIASGNALGVIQLWDTATGKERRRLAGHRQGTYGLAFARDGKTLASVGQQLAPVKLWDVATGKELRRLERRGEGLVHSLAFSPDGKTLAVGGGTVQLWDVATGRDAAPFVGQDGAVWCAACSPDGKRVALAGGDPVVRVWDTTTSREVCRCKGHELPVIAVAFRPDGRTLVSVSRDRTVRTWDAASGKELARFTAEQTWIDRAAFSPDGKVLAASAGKSLVRLWDVASGKELPQLKAPQEEIGCLAFSADGRRLAWAVHAAQVRVWNLPSGREVRRLGAPGKVVYALAFSPDGRTLATAGWNDAVRLWEVATGAERGAVPAGGAQVFALAFSPDGRTVVWAARDPLVRAAPDPLARLWDVKRGRELAPLRGHRAAVSALAFSPDGRFLTTGSEDTTALVWDTRTVCVCP